MTLYPIRIDVAVKTDPQARIIDTILWDDTAPNNIEEIAYAIVADAQVHSMARSSGGRFTGRLEFNVIECWKRAVAQMQQQIESLRTRNSNATKQQQQQSLIPIRLRLSYNGIRIHDDFNWDPSLSSSVTVIDMAESIIHDLQLPTDFVPVVAIAISEQVHGLNVDIQSAPDPGDKPPTGFTSSTSAAWELEGPMQLNHTVHLVSQHRF